MKVIIVTSCVGEVVRTYIADNFVVLSDENKEKLFDAGYEVEVFTGPIHLKGQNVLDEEVQLLLDKSH